MMVILILILIGYYFYKRGVLDDSSVRTISAIVVDAANPALLINAALTSEMTLSLSLFLEALGLMGALYAILIVCGLVIPVLLRIPKHERYSCEMLTIHGNCGFIGFPVCSAVLGPDSLVYASINCLIFNIIFYTYSIWKLQKEAAWQAAQRGERPEKTGGGKAALSMFFNPGTIAAMITVFLYLVDVSVPVILADVISYLGGSCVFLSMLVLGSSVAKCELRSLITGPKRMWVFLAIRMLALPILLVLLVRPLIRDSLMLGTFAIMVSLPGGNLPLMMAEELNMETRELSRGIVLSTALCVVTIPVVCAVTL